MRLLLPLALIALTACSVPVVRETLPNFNGKSTDYAVSWLGVPDRQYDYDGYKILEWSNSYAHTYSRPRASLGMGWGSGGYSGVGIGIPIGDYGGYEYETYRQECQIKLMTKKNIVQGYEFYGDDNGCAKYAERLKPLQAQMQGGVAP